MPLQRLHADKYEQLIARRGRDVKWQQASLCSCWNLDSGQPSYSCNACRGKGYTYETPVIERALVMSITQSKDFDESAGVFEVGDAVMTVPKRVFTAYFAPQNQSGVPTFVYDHDSPMFEIGMYDLVTLMDDEHRTSEVLIKGEAMYGRPADTVLNDEVTSIQSIRQSDPDTGTVTVFEPETDYIHTGGLIEWVAGRGPLDGTQYSVTYKHRPVYTVLIPLPKPRHQDGQDLPRYVALRYRAGGFDRK